MSSLSFWQSLWVRLWPHRFSVKYHVPGFLKACPESLRGQVLEVGAGGGSTSKRILDTFPQVELTATDIDATVLARLQIFSDHYGRRLKIQPADVLALPFDRASFDVALAINVLGHLQGAEIVTALRELIRVVRPGGLIGISQSHRTRHVHELQAEIVRVILAENCAVKYIKDGYYLDMWIERSHQGINVVE